MKIKQIGTPEEFKKITKPELHQLWFNERYTDKAVGLMYGVTAKEVKEKRKEFKLTMWTGAWLYVIGGDKFADKRKQVK